MPAAHRKDAAVPRPYSFVSDEEWQAIFRAVETGSTLAKAVRLSLGPDRDPSVAYTAIRNDPLGKGRTLSNSREIFRGAVMDEIKRRAISGYQEPHFHDGQVCGYITRYSDRLLESLARNLPGSDWLDGRKASDVNVTTHGDNASSDVLFSLDYSTVAQMPPHIRRSLLPALTWLREFANVPQSAELATADVTDVIEAVPVVADDFALTSKQKAGDWS